VSGHGWVTPLPGGAVAKCGGPAICGECRRELNALPVEAWDGIFQRISPGLDAEQRLGIIRMIQNHPQLGFRMTGGGAAARSRLEDAVEGIAIFRAQRAHLAAGVMSADQQRATDRVLQEVALERVHQHQKWGEQNHPMGMGPGLLAWMVACGTGADAARELCEAQFKEGRGTYALILWEEMAEAFAEAGPEAQRKELLQVAAVAVAAVEAIDRAAGGEGKTA
jgi:hypothetical protein